MASAVLAYLLGQRRISVERKRTLCAEAIADALQWLELPYRIRRRTDNTPETLTALGDRINDLRERLQFHEKWLRIEVPQSVVSYQRLVGEVIAAAGREIEKCLERLSSPKRQQHEPRSVEASPGIGSTQPWRTFLPKWSKCLPGGGYWDSRRYSRAGLRRDIEPSSILGSACRRGLGRRIGC